LFLNNDTVPTQGWLEEMIKVVERDPRVGIVGSKLLFPNNTIQHAGVFIADNPWPITPCHAFYKKPSDAPEVNMVKEYQCVTGACMLIRKSLFDETGGFDESYLNGYEDVDLCFKVREKGFKIVYTPKSVLYHFESQTATRHDHENQNIKLLNRRWRGKIQADMHLESVSIIIVTYNSANDILTCLNSVASNTSIPFEIIIVDNNSTDSTRKIIDQYINNSAHPIIKLENNENLGFSRACNQGLKIAKGKYIAFLNPDTIVTPNWIINLLSHFGEKIAAVGPISNYAAGMQNLLRYLPELGRKIDSLPLPEISKLIHVQFKGQSIETKLLIGFCLISRADILKEIGGLNERLFLGNDDLDLSWRLREKGCKLLIAKDVFIYHKGQASFETKPSDETQRLVQESTDSLADELIDYYGFGNVPLPEDLWGITWFRPSPKYLGMFKPIERKVSIVILNYKLPEDTIECLESIYENIHKKFQVILVDNGSGDDSAEKISRWAQLNQKSITRVQDGSNCFPEPQFYGELILAESSQNLGFSGGNNLALKYALNGGTDYVWFLNNDTVIKKDALFELLRLAEHDLKIGIVCSKLHVYGQAGKVQYNGEKVVYEGFVDSRKDDHPRPTAQPSGCSMLVKRDVFETVGYLDDDYFLYFEDNDFATRATKKGWSIYYTPYSKVYHKGGASTGGWLAKPFSLYYFIRNHLIFCVKHNRFTILKAYKYIGALGKSILSRPEMLRALVLGIEDFLSRKWGKAEINFDALNKTACDNRKVAFHFTRDRRLITKFEKKKKKLLYAPGSKTLNDFIKTALTISKIEFPSGRSELEICLDRAESLFQRGQVEEATRILKKLLEIEPLLVQAHNNLAFIHWERKEIESALYHITKALELSRDDKDVVWNAAHIMIGVGLNNEAAQVLKRFIDNHPEDNELKELYENIQISLVSNSPPPIDQVAS